MWLSLTFSFIPPSPRVVDCSALACSSAQALKPIQRLFVFSDLKLRGRTLWTRWMCAPQRLADIVPVPPRLHCLGCHTVQNHPGLSLACVGRPKFTALRSIALRLPPKRVSAGKGDQLIPELSFPHEWVLQLAHPKRNGASSASCCTRMAAGLGSSSTTSSPCSGTKSLPTRLPCFPPPSSSLCTVWLGFVPT